MPAKILPRWAGRGVGKLSPAKFGPKIGDREIEGRAIKQIIAYIKAQTKRVMTPRRGLGWDTIGWLLIG